MGFVRIWWPPVVVGLVVAFLGIGVVEVAGMPAGGAPVAESARARPSPRPPSVVPAAIERDDDLTGADEHSKPAVPSHPSPIREPAARPAPTHDVPSKRPRPRATLKALPTRRPVPTALPTGPPAPRPSPTAPPLRRVTPIVRLTPSLTPTPAPTPAPAPEPVRLAEVLDLRPWKLTLPTGREGHPTEFRQPVLSSLRSGRYVRLTPDRGVAFRAPVGGATTGNSSYPRSELREMSGGGRREAAWTNTAGRHVMTISQAITATPQAKPHVVAGQIHDADDDVVMIRLEGSRLFVESDGDDVGLLDPHYRLGRKFTVSITATRRGIDIVYNGHRTVHQAKVGRGWYFKAGCYPQSNPDHGDRPTAYGEVVIYALTVRHV